MLIAWLTLFGGLALLVRGSDWLVDGAMGISNHLGLSPLVVGLTVVAYGTSLPEFVVSLLAAMNGVGDMAVGNVVGSNIANLGLAWGAALLVGTSRVSDRTIYRRDLPMLVLVSVGFYTLAIDGTFSRSEGVLLLGVALFYTVIALRTDTDSEQGEASELSMPKALFWLTVGVAGLVIGADLMVDGAVEIARGYGVGERLIGLTIIALGTSLPEVAATVAAARRNEGGLALGNILGSCLFNLSFVVGGASLFTPLEVHQSSLSFDMPLMLGITILAGSLLYAFKRGSKWHGAVLLFVYLTFLAILAEQAFL
ncbi:MAG: calcium/sodium antiporter [Bradymonadia bacterium]